MENSLKKIFRPACLCATSAIALSTFSLPEAHAQSDDSGLSLETIMVTARQRAESIQDVPLAITAFSADSILKKNIQDLNDVARFTAGFAFEDLSGGFGIAVIRGQSQIRTAALEQPVATFLNGVYLPRSYMVDIGTNNLQRIEIVKGPQSSRYGRNAFAGAINYISPSANTSDIEAEAMSTVGNGGRFDVNGAVSLPVVKDVLAVRLGINHTQFGGVWENQHPNANAGINPGTNGDVGGWNNLSYSANVVFTPTENLRIEANYNGYELDEEAAPTNWLNTNIGDGNCGSVATAFDPVGGPGGGPLGTPGIEGPRLFCGTFGVDDDFVIQDPRAYGRQSDTDIGSIKIDWDVSEAITASYLYGHAQSDTRNVFTSEADQVNCGGIFNGVTVAQFLGVLCNFQGQPQGSINYDSHEFRVRYDNNEALAFELGGFYSDGRDVVISTSINIAPLGTDPAFNDGDNSIFPDNIVFGRVLNTTEVVAVFGEVQYRFPNEKTRLTAELRYTSEEIGTLDLRAVGVDPFEETFNFMTPRVTVEHDLYDDTMLYATVARGAKAGGFNANVVLETNRTFRPEFNWTYEAGVKSTFWDQRAVLNAAVFYTSWKGQQINGREAENEAVFAPSITTNQGDATVYGIELEGSVLLTENITIDGTASWVSSTFDNGTIDQQFAAVTGFFANNYNFDANGNPQPLAPCDGVVCEPGGDIGGNDIPRTPPLQLSLGAEWRDELGVADGEYFVRADMSYQNRFFADTVNLSRAPGRFLTNARAGVSFENIDISIWARNLFDKKYVSSSLQIIQSGGANLLGTFYGERRTFGLTASLRY